MKDSKRRARCPDCTLICMHCVCAHIAPIDNRTPVRVLQHPNERHHALNTARWVVAGLRQAQCLCKPCFTPSDWQIEGREPVLLFPAERDAPAGPDGAAQPADDHCSLVVIDGTWRQAAAILRMHPALLSLRRLSLPAAATSAYRLRKSPRADGLSTVEAVAAALDIMDAPTNHAAILRPFQAHIDQQIATQRAHMGEHAFRRNYPQL